MIIIAVFVIVMLTLPNSNEGILKIPGSFVLNEYAPFLLFLYNRIHVCVDRFDFNETKNIYF